MYRTRFERLEQRKMFSVTDLILDPIQVESLVGDFNGDGRDDLAEVHVLPPEALDLDLRTIIGGHLLPYLEQDNVYKLHAEDGAARNWFAHIAAADSISPTTGGAQLVSIVDGTSNTVMFSENVAPINVDLLGVRVDTSPIDLTVASLDVWEHAYSVTNGPAANGIIAILIGLAADPSDPSGDAAGAAALADRSVRRVAASLLASDEYFFRFSDTTFDDESLVATTFGRGLAPSKITHDAEFEKWANASAFDQGSSPSAFYDLLISSILHEENEFSFPRMFTGGVYVG